MSMFCNADVNECQTNIAFCAENADCADTEGSYTCACSTGFMGDGFISCTGAVKLQHVVTWQKKEQL